MLEVIYLIFNEGYAATARRGLDAALAVLRTRCGSAASSPSSCPTSRKRTALVALDGDPGLAVARARRARRRAVLLLDQNRARWDQLLIGAVLPALERVEGLGVALGPYALQAAIAACHARARTPQETDWARIAALYDALAQLAPSPVVELNRAVAVAMAFGPAAGLEIVDAIAAEPSLAAYHLLPSVRGDLLQKLARLTEARAEFERAASLTRNVREKHLLLERAARCRI